MGRAVHKILGPMNTGVFVLLFTGMALAGTKPQEPMPATTSYSPQELVRRMVETELRAQEHDHSKWRFVSRKEADGKIIVTEKVQTSGGTLKRTLALNSRSLPPDEQAKEEKQLEQLVSDPSAQQKKLRDEREDAEKAKNMFRMFPDAFVYSHAFDENGLTA